MKERKMKVESIEVLLKRIYDAKSYAEISYSRESDFHNDVLNNIIWILEGGKDE